MRSSLFQFLLLCVLGAVQAVSFTGSRLLVLLDDTADQSKYSQFWSDLESRNYQITFESPKSNPALFKHGELAYDHLLILPARLKALGPALTPQILLDFVKANGNILLGLSTNTPTPSSLVSLLLELDIHIPQDKSSVLVDHFNYDSHSSEEKHDVILLQPSAPARVDLKDYLSIGDEKWVAFPATVGQVLGNESPLLTPLIPASPHAYIYNPSEEFGSSEDPFATGAQISIISALQARNSARVTVLGSVELLEDKWFTAQIRHSGMGHWVKDRVQTGNREFAQKLSQWAFKETGVLQVGKVKHYLNEPSGIVPQEADMNPKIYRVKNNVTFTIELSEYTSTHLSPFTAPDKDDIQLEFSMLSPFHRLSLRPLQKTANSTIYGASFTIPDQHGIFNFRVNYKRPLLTSVDEKHTVTVRHFAHDEYTRSWNISGAWVWILGIWVTVVGWLGFIVLWLYSEPRTKQGVKWVKKAQ